MTTRSLEDAEIKAIFQHISGTNAVRNRCMIIVGIGMALRASELVGLTVGDVYDGEKVRNYVTIRGDIAKFGKEREIRVWDIVGEKLFEFIDWKIEHGESIDRNAPLFVSREGGHLTRQALFELIKKIFRSAGINQSCHALRKTGATIFYMASDYDLVSTQLFLGHASPETTRRYIGIPSQRVKQHSITSSQWLANAIEFGEFEFDAMLNMSNSKLTIKDAIEFLNQKCFEVSLKPMQERRKVEGYTAKREPMFIKVAKAYYEEWQQIEALSEPLDWDSDWVTPEWRIGT